MTKLTLLPLFLAVSSFAQTATVVGSITTASAAVDQDIAAFRLSQIDPTVGTLTLAAPVGTLDLTVTLTDASKVSAISEFQIDSEWFVSSAKVGNVLTVTRANEGSVAAAHLITAKIVAVKDANPRQLYRRIIREKIAAIIQGLGSTSATISANLATITSTQTTISTTTSTAVQ